MSVHGEVIVDVADDRYGEYFKYIDELSRSLDGFKILWQAKKWQLFPLNDALWAMFYYTQLYICAFSFVRSSTPALQRKTSS